VGTEALAATGTEVTENRVDVVIGADPPHL
jgi:hypothetical protein